MTLHILISITTTFFMWTQINGRPSFEPHLEPIKFKPVNIREDILIEKPDYLYKTINDYSPEVQKLLLSDFQDPEVSPGLFQGDIAGLPIDSYMQWRLGLKWQTFPEKKWPNKTVPYHISNKYSDSAIKVIQTAISTLQFLTCVKFIPYDGKVEDYLLIWPVENPGGCWSFVGKTGGQQPLSLSPPKGSHPKCLGSVGKPIHELLHALGVFHEHSRSDRDEYITIQTENIASKFLHNFKKASLANTTQPYTYDYNSIMHYGANFFSIDINKQTIVPKDSMAKIGQRQMLSKSDCLKINELYDCFEENSFSKQKYMSFCNDLAL